MIGVEGTCQSVRTFNVLLRPIGGKRQHIGMFGTAKEAAEAYDQAALQAKFPSSEVNFPDMIHMKKKTPKRKKRKLVTCTTNETNFHGVSKIGKKFRASVFLAGKLKHFGIFTKARDAAMAYDVAIVELSGKSIDELNSQSQLNFPNGMKEE